MNERAILEYLATQDERIKALYNQLIQQLADIGMSIDDIPADQIFSFNNYPSSAEKVTEALKKYSNVLIKDITRGIGNAFVLSFASQSASLGDKSVFSGIALDNLRNTARDSFLDYRLKPERGLSLSQNVWNYTLQAKAEFEMAMSDVVTSGLSKGESAESLGRRIRGLLNNPDAMYRRYHLKKVTSTGKKVDVVEWRKRTVDVDGKVHFISTDIEHPGAGVYRSARQNALRLAATEVNMAYRYADWARWQNEPFVIGIHIRLSGNHTCKDSNGKPQPFYDMCDELVGDYPKSFKFSGWHPRCYDDKSEVLTDRGWLFFNDVQPTDKIFSLVPDSKNVEWVGISKIMSWEHEGLMCHFYNRNIDCLVTPEHEMVHLSKDGEKRILRKSAKDYSKNNGGFYRSSCYDNPNRDNIVINGLLLPFDAFCEFMGYYLSDGSACRSYQISIAQQDCPTKPKIVSCIKNLGLKPCVTDSKVYVYNTQLCEYLKQFGHSAEKYVPKEIKDASRRQIEIFLGAFNACDGHIKKPHKFVGNRGGICEGHEVREFFTSSKQMASDLGELLVKIGTRPSYRIDKKEGVEHTFKNGTYKLNADAIRITECYSETCTAFSKEEVYYRGMVYDLELERNHIMYIRRNGKCFWGSNCRCTATSILVSEEEFEEIRKLPASERANYVSPNMIKDMPENFKKYVAENKDRIEAAIGRGTEPYWVRDNYRSVMGEDRIVRNPLKVTPSGVVEPTATSPTSLSKAIQTAREDSRILTETQLAEIMAKDRELYAQYLLDNMDVLETLLGVPRGTSMSWEMANKGAENPHYSKGGQWTVNCQTCTVVHEMRRRGFNVKAMGKYDGFNKLTHRGTPFGWQYRFLNPDGSKIKVEHCGEWAQRKGYTNVTRSRMNEYFAEKMAEDGRYEIYCIWDSAKGAKNGAHVFLAEKKNGVVKFFDPQNGREAGDIDHYFTKMQNKYVYAMRIDDKIINPEMVKAFVADAGIIETRNYVIAKPKTSIELAREKRHANRNVYAIRTANEIRHAMSQEDREVFNMLNAVARLEGEDTMDYFEIFRVADRDDDGVATVVKVRRKNLSPKMLDAMDKYDKTMQSLSKIDVASVGKKRSEILKRFIEEQRRKAISSISRGKTTWVDAPYYARKKFKELQTQRAAIKTEWDATRAARNGGSATQSLADAKSLDEIRAILGADMPKTLLELDDAIQQFTRVPDFLKQNRGEVQQWMKELIDNSDYGMAIRHSILDSVSKNGFYNTFQSGSSGGYNGSSKTTGLINKDHARLRASHQFFNPSQHSKIKSWSFEGTQLKREEYEKYGHLLMRDKEVALHKQAVGQYGDVQVRFKKDKVVATWTADDSLNMAFQPTLVNDPKIESFDNRFNIMPSKNDFKDVLTLRNPLCSRYIELQYHGKLGIDCVESLTFPKGVLQKIDEAVIRRFVNAGARIFYEDANGKIVEKVYLSQAERAKQLKKQRAEYWKKKLQTEGMTREEYVAKLRSERAAEILKARSNAQSLIDVGESIENKDISLDKLRKEMAKGNYFGAQKEAERIRAQRIALKAREDAVRDYIPNVEDYHKQFTMDDIEAAYNAVKKDFARYEREAPGDLEKQLSRLTFQRDYVENPGKYKEGRVRHSTWEIAQGMIDKKIVEVNFTIRQNKVNSALADIKAYNTRSAVIKGHIKNAETLLASGDLDGALAEIAKANKVKADYEYQKQYEARKKAEKSKTAETILKEGESHGIVFDKELFAQAQKDAAKWFRGSGNNPTSAEIRKAFKAADDYMSQYAEEMWKNLSQEEKHVLWLYTDGSRYINEEMTGTYCLRLRSVIDGSFRNGLADANKLTSIIDKAPALKEGMWMQTGKSAEAFKAMFGESLNGSTDPSSLIGKVGKNDLFTSCHTARDGAFTKATSTGSLNDVILSIYMPKGTKGVYMEPFASFGDEKNPYKRGKNGFNWDGKKRNETPSDQVEFLLQRGAKFCITKAVKGSDGKWYIDVDLIELPAQKALNTKISRFDDRRIRDYREAE